ncbi:hypothetical protein PR048_025847 [Dryococelus australis]|uniref:Uncharacterized protein n=1 Tax=Dryococelus australis TaxID=614101 RepID=A0ABQ9GJQ4_9NEOP|nr:hypothetical protein PR048_025847 [Dryococelus australis]
MLKRAQTDKICQKTDALPATKYVQYTSPETAKEATCFFSNKIAGREGLHEASTFELDARVRTCTRLVEDNDLLDRQSAGDMVALEAKYHTTYLVQLYNKTRKPKSTAMTRHSMYVVQKDVDFLNPGQFPVITFDQPLFALVKKIQWKWPELYGEEKIVVMLGGLHIEMAALKMLGNLLEKSRRVEVLVEAEVATGGTAYSFLKVAHITGTRSAHQMKRHNLRNGVVAEKMHPQFKYWSTVFEMELIILVLVRSFRLTSFQMYLNALHELAPWFHVLDHINYARCISVHLTDMANLPMQHPSMDAGCCTVHKTTNTFSSIPIGQAHKQNHALIKGEAGAVGFTDNMIFANRVWRDTWHHDQTSSVQAFTKDVCSLVNVMEKLGNRFEEESVDLISIATKKIAGPPTLFSMGLERKS